jgi:hypothetical protein
MAEIVVDLPVTELSAEPSQMQLSEAAFGKLLGVLASRPGPVPKYLYPSAGTLYPVQAYVILRRPLGRLAAGSYYYDPDEHALARLSDAVPAAPDGSEPGALLMLVARYSAIEPIYRAETQRFCLLEAGYMAELLAGTGIRMREAGDPANAATLAAACALDADHVPLICWAIGEDS